MDFTHYTNRHESLTQNLEVVGSIPTGGHCPLPTTKVYQSCFLGRDIKWGPLPMIIMIVITSVGDPIILMLLFYKSTKKSEFKTKFEMCRVF